MVTRFKMMPIFNVAKRNVDERSRLNYFEMFEKKKKTRVASLNGRTIIIHV